MPELQFESLGDSLGRLPEVIRSIPDLLREPSANPTQSLILLGIVLLLALIVLMSVVLAVMGRSDEDEEYPDGIEDGTEPTAEDGTAAGPDRLSQITVACAVVLVATLVWVVAGITTGSAEVCTSCHSNTEHSTAVTADPHTYVACVDCHETGGPVARATVNLPLRLQHMILARLESADAKSYGRPIASDGCIQCHDAQIQGVITNKERGLRMAHEQPLDAGAPCVYCHILSSGVIGLSTGGMAPCLRCHNDTVTSADCAVCHIGNPGDAIRSEPATAMASQLVPNPTCGGCHFDMTSCTNCHGILMPHSAEFMAYGHAREAALDIWYNDGKTCAKCHYAGRNSCVREGCHMSYIPGGHPNPAWAELHQSASWSDGGRTSCSCHQWNPYDHAGMTFCQVCHPVKPKNALP